ncbi:CvpA family protein [Galbibacter sp. BG1]|uniref:CvpA family protein n=1 Tax=Galbibacter sp. BG1 TaxID=1170699 RepID=UPI0015BDD721|nr:CvpA family protein [Galbibacter sp. BG1]QLE01340.1 CvpA family protein [Galbibacter sp. BG1]
MNYIDIILGGLIIFGMVRGFMKGLFIEVASLLALVVGIYGAIHFSYFVGDFLTDKVDWEQKYINLTAFAITFILIILAVSLIGKLLTKIASLAALGLLNRIFGAVFGGLKVAIILGAILIFLDRGNEAFTFIDQKTLDASIIYKPVKDIGSFVFDWVLRETASTSIEPIEIKQDF